MASLIQLYYTCHQAAVLNRFYDQMAMPWVSAQSSRARGSRAVLSPSQGMQGWPVAPLVLSLYLFQGFTGSPDSCSGPIPHSESSQGPSSLKQSEQRPSSSLRPPPSPITQPGGRELPDPPMHCPSFARHLDTSESVQPSLERAPCQTPSWRRLRKKQWKAEI